MRSLLLFAAWGELPQTSADVWQNLLGALMLVAVTWLSPKFPILGKILAFLMQKLPTPTPPDVPAPPPGTDPAPAPAPNSSQPKWLNGLLKVVNEIADLMKAIKSKQEVLESSNVSTASEALAVTTPESRAIQNILFSLDADKQREAHERILKAAQAMVQPVEPVNTSKPS